MEGYNANRMQKVKVKTNAGTDVGGSFSMMEIR